MLGRPFGDGYTSANIPVGNSLSRCSARNANTLPAGISSRHVSHIPGPASSPDRSPCVGPGGGDGRASWLREVRAGRRGGERPQRDGVQDGADRGRAGAAAGPPRPAGTCTISRSGPPRRLRHRKRKHHIRKAKPCLWFITTSAARPASGSPPCQSAAPHGDRAQAPGPPGPAIPASPRPPGRRPPSPRRGRTRRQPKKTGDESLLTAPAPHTITTERQSRSVLPPGLGVLQRDAGQLDA
jgi:hypothetical protein